MQRAMARQAEAERERRAKVIAAEGEFQASEQLREAAERDERRTRSRSSCATCRRCSRSSSERSTTIVLPLPLDLFRPFLEGRGQSADRPTRRLTEPRAAIRVERLSGRRGRRPRRAGRAGPDAGGAPDVSVLRGARGADAARESLALGRPGGAPDTPGWQRARRAEPRIPALERPGGRRSTPRGTSSRSPISPPDELEPDRRGVVAPRGGAARDEGFPYVHAFVNEGAAAGAAARTRTPSSCGFASAPPAVAARAPGGAAHVDAGSSWIERARDGRASRPAPCGRAALPYELVIAPSSPSADAFELAAAPAALELLGDSVAGCAALEGDVPFERVAPRRPALAPRARPAPHRRRPGSSSAPASTSTRSRREAAASACAADASPRAPRPPRLVVASILVLRLELDRPPRPAAARRSSPSALVLRRPARRSPRRRVDDHRDRRDRSSPRRRMTITPCVERPSR